MIMTIIMLTKQAERCDVTMCYMLELMANSLHKTLKRHSKFASSRAASQHHKFFCMPADFLVPE